MSVKITLDRPALAAYIDADPDFKIELNAAILSEVVTKFFSKDMDRIIRESDRALFDKAVLALKDETLLQKAIQQGLTKYVASRGWGSTTLTPEAKTLIQEGINKALTEIQSGLTLKALAKAEEVLPAVLDSLDERIEKRLARKLEESIDNIVDRKVNERLAGVLNGLKGA
jgi:hypothetical protein